MKLLVLFNVILYAMCVAGRGWNSDATYTENCAQGKFSEWISYLKRLSLVVLMLSLALLYYVPRSRYHAKKGCRFMIDNVAKGLKSALSLSESDITQEKQTTLYSDSFVPEVYTSNKYETRNANYESRYNKNKLNIKMEEEERLSTVVFTSMDNLANLDILENRRQKRNTRREIPKEDVSEQSLRNHHRHRHRHRRQKKYYKSAKGSSELCEETQRLISNLTYYGHVDNASEFPIPDGSMKSSVLHSTRNSASYFISGSPRQMAMLDSGQEDANIFVLDKLYPTKQIFHKSIIKSSNDDYTDDGHDRNNAPRILSDVTYDVNKVNSAAETVTPKRSQLKSTYEVNHQIQHIKKPHRNIGSNNNLSKITHKRVSEREENGIEANIIQSNHSADVNSVENDLQAIRTDQTRKTKNLDTASKAEESDDNDGLSTGAELLSELGDQINKLDYTIRMMRPASTDVATANDAGREEYALQAVEAVLKDIKRGFGEYDEGMKRRKKTKLTSSGAYKRNSTLKKDASRECIRDNDEDFTDDETILQEELKRMVSSRKNNMKLNALRKEKKEKSILANSYNVLRNEESEGEDAIPIFTKIKT